MQLDYKRVGLLCRSSQFLEQSRCDPSKAGFNTLLEALSKRRPDLQHLRLSCANSKNMIPYIAIVNEIMEAFIATEGGVSGTMAVGNEADEEVGSSGKAAALGEQATQVFRDTIATRMHPLKFFPYHQGLDATKTYLSSMGIPFAEIASTFRSTACIISQFISALPDDGSAREGLLREADLIWRRADVANTLNLQPLDFSAVSRENIYTTKFLDTVAGLASGDSVTDPLSHILSVPKPHLSWGYDGPGDMLNDSEKEKTGLCFICKQLLPRSGLTFKELLEIVNTTYFAGRLVITNINNSQVFDGQLSEMRLRALDTATDPSPVRTGADDKAKQLSEKNAIGPLTEELCHELQGFIRLRNKLGWTTNEVDVAIGSLTENHTRNCTIGSLDEYRGITYRLLEDLSYVVKLSDLTDVSASSLFPLWAQINSRGEQSLYSKVFLRPISFVSLFKPGSNGKYFETSDAIENHIPALTMALKLGNEDLDCIITAAGVQRNTELDMDVLSRLYRHTILCRMLDAPTKDYSAILSLFPHQNPFLDPKTTLEAVTVWKQLTRSGWSTTEILSSAACDGIAQSNLALLSQDSVTRVSSVLANISRTAYLVKKLELSAEELKYLSTPGGLVSIQLETLTLQGLCQLDVYRQLRDSAAKDRSSLLGLFGWLDEPDRIPNGTGGLASRLAAATTWPQAQLTTALNAKYANMSVASQLKHICSLEELSSLQAVMEVSSRVKTAPGKEVVQPLLTLFRVATPTRPDGVAKDFARADELRMLLGRNQLKQCTDELRERQRTALVEFLLQQPYVKEMDLFDADALFDYFLVDVNMGAQLEITRMKQAISTVQMYVQRCLLGLEADNGVTSSSIVQTKWQWMQKHNVWAATRKGVL